MTWSQYASQRRNSLQRRKIEINKRLQKTKSNSNNPNNNAILKSKNKIQKEIEQLKLTAATPKQAVFKNSEISKGYEIDNLKPNHLVSQLTTGLKREKIEVIFITFF